MRPNFGVFLFFFFFSGGLYLSYLLCSHGAKLSGKSGSGGFGFQEGSEVAAGAFSRGRAQNAGEALGRMDGRTDTPPSLRVPEQGHVTLAESP